MRNAKLLTGLVVLAVLVSLLLFWLAWNRFTFIFSVAAYGYPQNLVYVALNLVFLGVFVLFIKFRGRIARLPASAYLAFLIALYIEMYGFPLTMYFFLWFFNFSSPGNLWYLLTTIVGEGLFTSIFYVILLPASNTIILIGLFLIIFGWRKTFNAKGQLITSGIYRYVRHPQYLGFLLLTLGINILWITLTTLLLWPVLILLYYRLAKEEEKRMEKKFGEKYQKYKNSVPMFIPRLKI
jgi:protein-S-isoprenylcysteine O-methyltransferase Ste14